MACSYQGKAALWNCKPGDPKALWLTKATRPVTALLATPDGRWLVTGHDDGTLRFWPVQQLILIERACAAAGEEPRAAEAVVDQVTRLDVMHYGRSSPQARDSASESAGTSRRPRSHPNEALAG